MIQLQEKKLFLHMTALQVLMLQMHHKRARAFTISVQPQELDRLIKEFTPSFRKLLSQMWAADQNKVDRKMTAELFSAGGAAEVNQEFAPSTVAFLEKWKQKIHKAYTTAIQRFANRIGVQVNKRFIADLVNQRILDFLENEALLLGRSLSATRLKTLRESLKLFIKNDYSIAEATRLLQQQVPLTKNMAKHVGNVYQRALNAGQSKTEALRLARVASEKAKKWRSKMIIRTEMNRAKQEANIEAIKQAINRKLIKDEVYKTWIRQNYVRNHENSINNDGVSVPLDGLWRDGSLYPAEINEYCTVDYNMIKI